MFAGALDEGGLFLDTGAHNSARFECGCMKSIPRGFDGRQKKATGPALVPQSEAHCVPPDLLLLGDSCAIMDVAGKVSSTRMIETLEVISRNRNSAETGDWSVPVDQRCC